MLRRGKSGSRREPTTVGVTAVSIPGPCGCKVSPLRPSPLPDPSLWRTQHVKVEPLAGSWQSSQSRGTHCLPLPQEGGTWAGRASGPLTSVQALPTPHRGSQASSRAHILICSVSQLRCLLCKRPVRAALRRCECQIHLSAFHTGGAHAVLAVDKASNIAVHTLLLF